MALGLTPLPENLRDQDLTSALRALTGYTQFQPGQEEAITALIQGQDAFVMLPTGGGKSLIYQLAGVIRGGCTVVISPLIALMQDQVASLRKRGILAFALDSQQTDLELGQAMYQAANAVTSFLFLSPERLDSPTWQRDLVNLPVKLIAIDEAHCMVQWGHQFRPSYLRLGVLRQLFEQVPIVALTATATPTAQAEIIKHLRLHKPAIVLGSVARPNLRFQVSQTLQKQETLRQLLNSCQGPAIVYTRSRKRTWELQQLLAHWGLSAATYQAGMPAEARKLAMQQFMDNQVQFMVATSAFGMGVDKADIRLVVHYEPPPSIEDLYQEAGRAGRDGQAATCVVLYNDHDLQVAEHKLAQAMVTPDMMRQVYHALITPLQLPIYTETAQHFPLDHAATGAKVGLLPEALVPILTALEAQGYIRQHQHRDAVCQVWFKAPLGTYEQLHSQHPRLGKLAAVLMRYYQSSLYAGWVNVSIPLLARALKWGREYVLSTLQTMAELDLIALQGRDAGFFFQLTTAREDPSKMLIDQQQISYNYHVAQERLSLLFSYLTHVHTCKQSMIGQVFGQQLPPCGQCDYCQQQPSGIDHNLAEEIVAYCQEPKNIFQLKGQFKAVAATTLSDVLAHLQGLGQLRVDKGSYIST